MSYTEFRVHSLVTLDAAAGPRRWRKHRQKLEPQPSLSELLDIPAGGRAVSDSEQGAHPGDIDSQGDACDEAAANVGTANG